MARSSANPLSFVAAPALHRDAEPVCEKENT
jgi:hypothetical protein